MKDKIEKNAVQETLILPLSARNVCAEPDSKMQIVKIVWGEGAV